MEQEEEQTTWSVKSLWVQPFLSSCHLSLYDHLFSETSQVIWLSDLCFCRGVQDNRAATAEGARQLLPLEEEQLLHDVHPQEDGEGDRQFSDKNLIGKGGFCRWKMGRCLQIFRGNTSLNFTRWCCFGQLAFPGMIFRVLSIGKYWIFSEKICHLISQDGAVFAFASFFSNVISWLY